MKPATSRTKVASLIGVLLPVVLGAIAAPVMAEQVTVPASGILRLVNPVDGSDVRLLVSFQLPSAVQETDIVSAILHIQTSGVNELAFAIGTPSESWTVLDTWSGLAARFDGDAVYAGAASVCQVSSIHVENDGYGLQNLGVEVSVTDLVSSWAGGGVNNGIFISRVAGSDTNVSSAIPEELPNPVLQILYTPK